ncbi:MAG TPA: hypothetical protein VFE53_10255 [Mucilaginibacter sp.]|jgi:hypothetical protein|nr:hypothetical protein [Mucilaginibacter sp.]
MKKVSLLIAAAFTLAAIFFTTELKAQTVPAGSLRMGIGFDAGDPTGNLTISSELVLGGTISLQYGVTNRFAVVLTSGADHFLSKYIPGTTMRYDSFGIIPIKAGFKAFYTPHLYVDGEIGVGIEEDDSGTGPKKFLVSPALGWAERHWDFSVRYDSYYSAGDNYGFVAVRIAYGFNFFTK